MNKIFTFGITDTSIALSFVGIIATFVVISNYMQVQEIKREFEEKINDINMTVQSLSKTIDLLATSNTRSIDPQTYQILGIDHNALVENWYILIKNMPPEKKTLEVFAKRFRNEYCKKEGNIHLIDDDAIYPSIKKYPLEGDEYINVADHFVALIPFDSDDAMMYLLKDEVYNKYKK